MTADSIHAAVRDHYGRAALRVMDQSDVSCCSGSDDGCGCGDSCCGAGYGADEVPANARRASLGCGNPVAVAELRDGERVLDLGSGGGIDVLLSARRVGPRGRAIGLDMTDEMLALAQRNAAEAGVDNVEFIKGTIEDVPLPAASVDVVISNCVINLAADKQAVFREIARVLRPGGRLGVADIVADDSLTEAQRAQGGSYVGCIAGALSISEYESGLRAAGFSDVNINPTHAVTAGMYSAIVRAQKPAAQSGPPSATA
jgi:arsenite methyltransferase